MRDETLTMCTKCLKGKKINDIYLLCNNCGTAICISCYTDKGYKECNCKK